VGPQQRNRARRFGQLAKVPAPAIEIDHLFDRGLVAGIMRLEIAVGHIPESEIVPVFAHRPQDLGRGRFRNGQAQQRARAVASATTSAVNPPKEMADQVDGAGRASNNRFEWPRPRGKYRYLPDGAAARRCHQLAQQAGPSRSGSHTANCASIGRQARAGAARSGTSTTVEPGSGLVVIHRARANLRSIDVRWLPCRSGKAKRERRPSRVLRMEDRWLGAAPSDPRWPRDQRFVITTSRYSLGTDHGASPARVQLADQRQADRFAYPC